MVILIRSVDPHRLPSPTGTGIRFSCYRAIEFTPVCHWFECHIKSWKSWLCAAGKCISSAEFLCIYCEHITCARLPRIQLENWAVNGDPVSYGGGEIPGTSRIRGVIPRVIRTRDLILLPWGQSLTILTGSTRGRVYVERKNAPTCNVKA